MSFLLEETTKSSFWSDFIGKFSYAWMWFAVIFAIIGVTLLILAKRIARIVKQRNNIEDNDGAYITFLVVACMFIVASVIIFIVMA